MEYRQLGGSGLKVPALSFGTGTFGGSTELFRAWGTTGVEEATRLVSLCLDAGVNMFDSADVYSDGLAEEILGKAIKGRRDKVIIATKATFPTGAGPNDLGSSRYHLMRAIEGSLQRLGTDYVDLYQMHVLDEIEKETGKTVPQIALNWLLHRPTVISVIIGARNEEQLRQNLGAVDWSLTREQIKRLDDVSATTVPYPYWHQRGFPQLNPVTNPK